MRDVTMILMLAMLAGAGSAWSGDQVDGRWKTAGVPPIVVEVVPGSERQAQTPADWLVPDEHTSILPLPGQPGTFLVFTGGRAGKATDRGRSGAIVMTTTDFEHFEDGSAYSYVSPVMRPLEPKDEGICTSVPPYDTLFDDNYAAPGSVFPDPGFPGSWLMLYEAENHCRTASNGNEVMVSPFYVSVGVARSFDEGRTWPSPAFLGPGYDSPYRYAGASPQSPKPTNLVVPAGDAIPSGLVSGGYIYAYFTDYPGNGTTKQIEVARAKDDGRDPLVFRKFNAADGWTTPASNRDGEVAGAGSSLIAFPDGFECGQVSVHRLVADGQAGLLFVMTMMCDNRNTAAVSGDTPQGAWFYATTSSLEYQQWSRPAMVANTLQYIDCSSGRFTGYYPSFFTPSQRPAHLGSTGDAIYLDGILTGTRALGVRKFRITVGTPPPFEPLPGISCPP